MRKTLFFILIIALLIPLNLYAAETPAALHITTHDTLIVGAFDCWLHSDGATWQNTDGKPPVADKPGDGIKRKAELIASIPSDLKEQYENITYKIKPFASDLSEATMQGYFAQTKGYSGQLVPDRDIDVCKSYIDFALKVLKYRPDQYQLISGTNSTTFYYPNDKDKTLDIKRMWQNQLVQGKRKLLPALVEFYGTPKQVAPPKPKEPTFLPCTEAPSIANTWETVYSWEVEHSSSYTDPLTGEEVDTSWTETVYETVPYSENLQAAVSVNTKQGIRESTWESRGSWEIIPWAKKNGLDPNEVTRSGYGFEVKVQTTYSTDWENKVPVSASPYGGTYKGPDKVVADFYDTKGRYVTSMNMVPTKGKPGDNYITWELPLQRYEYADGSRVDHRKHYTDVSMPDGKYMVKATISGAGKTDLCLIQKKYVTIYKDMWEDSYTRVSAHDE